MSDTQSLVGKYEGKRQLWRQKYRLEGNITIHLNPLKQQIERKESVGGKGSSDRHYF
jgi:hypothetical protein